MKYVFSFVLFLFSIILNAQDINISWQGYVTAQTDSVRASFYLAGPNLDLTTAFNDRNYPYWYVENQVLSVNGGVVSTMLMDVPLDTLSRHSMNTMFLYVSINGQPFDRVKINYVPYSAISIRSRLSDESEFAYTAAYANRTDTANFSYKSGLADSSKFSINAINSIYADSTLYALESYESMYSDSSLYSIYALRASLADNAQLALISDSAKRARFAYSAGYSDSSRISVNSINAQVAQRANRADSIADNSVTSAKIVDNTIQRSDISNGAITETALSDNSVTSAKIVDNSVTFNDLNITGPATNNSVVGFKNGSLEWVSNNSIQTAFVQKTTVIPSQLNGDARFVILQVAQDFNLVGIQAIEGRVITIVNASTANTVTLGIPNWNIYGGNVSVSPRSSKTLLYMGGEWNLIQ